MFNHLFFEMKMMTLFSMLFGAGLVLMDERADHRGASLRGVYYRRCLWLLVIGLIHAYLIWWGDILVMYAECGSCHLPVPQLAAQDADRRGRRLPAAGRADRAGLRGGARLPRKATAKKVEAAEKANEQPTRFRPDLHDVWKPRSSR